MTQSSRTVALELEEIYARGLFVLYQHNKIYLKRKEKTSQKLQRVSQLNIGFPSHVETNIPEPWMSAKWPFFRIFDTDIEIDK